jgi:site-specific DNA-methyltransferase (adenine-specific)
MKLMCGDCLELMKEIPDGSVDMILTDPPYGTTACKWDSVIPFEPMWERLNKLIKPNGAIVLFGSEPFSSALRMSNIKQYKYDWVWDKVTAKGHLVAKIRPMQQTENISVFGSGKIKYFPIMIKRDFVRKDVSVEYSRTEIVGGKTTREMQKISREFKYPKTVLTFSNASQKGKLHPTQKPVDLMEYLIKTYTNECETVLDFTMGSGSTGVACVNTNRDFIGIELDEGYFKIAEKRIKEAQYQRRLF